MSEQKKIGIYIIISPTDKFYIGQTIDFDRRLMQYKNLHCKGQRHLYNSFKKYGVENHHFIFFYETNDIFLERYGFSNTFKVFETIRG